MRKLVLPIILALCLITPNCQQAQAVSFPTTPILDSFNRSNGAPSGWTSAAFGDSFGITINTNTATSGGAGFGAAFYNVNTWKSAQNGVEAYFKISTLPTSGNTARIVICDSSACSSGGNAYYLIVKPSDSSWDFEKLVAGTGSQLGVNASQAVSANGIIGLSVVESGGTNTITGWYCTALTSCSSVATRTDSSNLSKKWYIGVELQDNVIRIDDFGGGIVGDNGKGFLML